MLYDQRVYHHQSFHVSACSACHVNNFKPKLHDKNSRKKIPNWQNCVSELLEVANVARSSATIIWHIAQLLAKRHFDSWLIFAFLPALSLPRIARVLALLHKVKVADHRCVHTYNKCADELKQKKMNKINWLILEKMILSRGQVA